MLTAATITTPRSTSMIQLVSSLLDEAYELGASDVHIDPTAAGMRVRFRIDGLLSERQMLPRQLRGEIVSRIKVLAGLRTDEHFASQDGRFRYAAPAGNHYADIRVSIAPTYYGENAVLRILADTAQSFTLEALGFEMEERERITDALTRQEGMILVTGPTGSGKTTTLYTLLKMLYSPEMSIVTIEDPIEYAIDGVRQIQTQSRTGLTFAHGLRALLRQDPDAIMVGEIRDAETAGIAINTALTGHILLSTLHTNDAATALPRLYDLGAEPYLIGSTLRLVIAQRLVRRLCDDCRIQVPISDALREHVSESHDLTAAWEPGVGCNTCLGTGYRGRLAVAEVLAMNEAIRDAIAERAPAQDIQRLARNAGMRTMRARAMEKAARGDTSLTEALAIS